MHLEHEKCLEIICFSNAHIEPILLCMLAAKSLTLLVMESIRDFVHLSISPSVGLLVHQSINGDQVKSGKYSRRDIVCMVTAITKAKHFVFWDHIHLLKRDSLNFRAFWHTHNS